MSQQSHQVWNHYSPVSAISILAIAVALIGCRNRPESPNPTAAMVAGSDPIRLTAANFQREVIDSNLPVIVDMWAPWCQPCIAMKPTIRELTEELAGEVKVAELNIEENAFIKEKYDVDRYPMLLIFIDGVEAKRLVGRKSKDEVVVAIHAAMSEQHAAAAIR